MNSVIENIITDIESRSKSVRDRVEKNGEVFTPFNLINEMLDKLPIEVWSNPNLKWLDPACGILNFPIILIQRLFIGLQYEITDEYLRMKHIIENMLYMDEYDITNYNLCVEYIQKIGGFKYNIHHGDFLTLDENKMMEIWNVNRFDVIVGNPPYNSGRTSARTTLKCDNRKKEGDTKRITMWIPFVEKAIDLLSMNGYLDFITPIGWFLKNYHKGIIHTKMMSKQIHFIKIYSGKTSNKIFNGYGDIHITYYLLQNKKIETPTILIDIDNKTEYMILNPDIQLTMSYNSIYYKSY
jgi:type I restriction-modification system DNA methylase subunit